MASVYPSLLDEQLAGHRGQSPPEMSFGPAVQLLIDQGPTSIRHDLVHCRWDGQATEETEQLL